MIKLSKQDEKQRKLSIVTDMSTNLANAIRRSVLEIPVMAIDEVEITKNDSALYDEIIAHRIGLVPIKTDKGLKETKFKIKEIGPKIVYSTDMKPSVETEYNLPIVLLDKEQELEVVCNANLGKGIDHIKYSPGLVFYKHDIDEDIIDYVIVDNEGKVIVDEDELKSIPEDKAAKIKKLKNVNELVFTIESWGQLKPKEIFLKSIEALKENLEDVEKAMK